MKQLLCCLLCLAAMSGFSQTKKTAPLTDIVAMVSKSLQELKINTVDSIKLKSVTADFTLSTTSSRGASLSIWIFKIGRKTDRTKMHTVSVHLEKSETDKRAIALRTARSAQTLTNFMQNALDDFNRLNKSDYLMELDNRIMTISIGLTISRSGTAGGQYDIGIFSLGAEGSRQRDQGHTLTLEFERLKPLIAKN